MTIAALIDEYAAGPAELRKLVAGLSAEQVRARPIPGKWSTLEVVCHLCDFEPIMADRMKRIIALGNGDVPLLLAADENLFVQALGYHDRDVEEELALIDLVRKQMARIIRSLAPEQLKQTGCHNIRGLVTLEQVIQGATNHIPHHAAFVAEKRKALGV